MTSAEKLHSIVAALPPGRSTVVDAKAIGVTATGFHSIVQTWAKCGKGPGFEVMGEPHADSGTQLYDKVRIRRTQ
jgi:hypothetical protein